MLRIQLRVFLALAALLAGAQACWAAPYDSTAKLTEAHGNVYKRDFRNWEANEWGDPQTANLGDMLHEGSQLGTGDKSWAQVSWPNLTTRAWSNSVYAIAPNRRLVYLTSGEMLYHLDKDRRDQSPYFVWTKFLSARIRGTTVLFQATEKTTRITVLEGCIDVTNRIDHSRMRLKPGVVLEVGEPHVEQQGQPAASAPADLTPITPVQAKPLTVFETKRTVASILPIDAGSITQHPLLSSFNEPLASLPLVQKALSGIGSLTGPLTSLLGAQKVLKSTFEILSVPMAMDYKVDGATISMIGLPSGAADFFPPIGLTGAAPGAVLPGITGTIMPIGLTAGSTVTGLVGGLTSAMPMTGTIMPTGAISSIGSVSTTVSGVTAGITQTTAALPGAIGGTVGSVGSLGGGLGGVVGGTLGSVGGLAGSLGGTVGGTLGGTVGALGGLLGH